jgi:Right handed beta helix region
MKKLLFLLFLINLNAQAAIRYVNINATGTNAGTSWANAFTSLQGALDVAVSGDQIWVAAGTYLPSKDPFGNATPTDAGDKTFYLKNGVSIYGGFVGTETALNQRTSGNETILTGYGIGCYHVVLSVADDNTTLLDKLTITKGSVAPISNSTSITVESQTIARTKGAGLYNKNSNIVLNNVFIISNNGMGIYNDNSSPTVQNAVFYDNSYVYFSPFPVSNHSGVYSENTSNPTIVNCTFFKNDYGSIYGNNNCAIIIKNCIFIPKTTGAEMFAYPGSTITVSNSSLPSVSSNYTGAVYPNITTSNNLFAQNPQFISETNLQGLDNKWGNADDGLQLKGPSPCINTGTSVGALSSDITGLARLGNPEMGAYEYNNTCPIFTSNIAYVNFAATGLNNGTSWANAFTDLESALNASRICGVTQIWVAKGTYKPTKDPFVNPNPTDPRDKTFYLYEGVAIYGGFAGTETAINQRIASNVTILSGDIGNVGDRTDNCYHVIISVNDANTTILDGLSIKYGNANGSSSISVETINIYRYYGGGITNIASSINCKNVVFSQNLTNTRGSGFYNEGGSPNLLNVVFNENMGNAGLSSYGGNVSLNNAVFAGNSSGIYNNTGGLNVANATFSRNEGTGIFIESGTQKTITNCIFWENYPKVSILGSNYPGIDIYAGSQTVSVSNTALQLVYNTTNYPTGFTNVTTSNNLFAQNPQFVDADNPAGADGIWMTADDGLALKNTSPCLNLGTATGTPTLDITGLGRTGNPEMGAYELNSYVYIACPYTYTSGIAYVNASATGLNNGTNWTNAYRSLESALKAARTCGVTQIWVAKGTYTPSKDPFGNVAPINHSEKTFYLVNGVALYGGFVGTEIAIGQRVKGNITNLDGYIGKDNPGNLVSCYSVVLSVSDLATTIIDGFTITNGNGDDLYNPTAPYFITVETKNIYESYGGGIYNESSSPMISNVVFLSNKNGGNYNRLSSPSYSNVVFSKNYLGMVNIDSNPIISNAVFSENENTSNSYAGAIANDGSSPTITNAVFYANGKIATNYTVTGGGGAIANRYNSNAVLKNCMFWANTKLGNATVVGADIENSNTSTINISYSSLQLSNNVTNYPAADYPNIGTNNNLFAQNPLFVNSVSPIGVDNIWMTADDGLALQSTSPNIDVGTATGTPLTDILGNVRSGVPDMGAYEFQAPSSIYETIVTVGNWNANATWNTNTPPTATKTAKINATHTVNVPNAGNQVKTIQMNGGSINLNGGTIQINN